MYWIVFCDESSREMSSLKYPVTQLEMEGKRVWVYFVLRSQQSGTWLIRGKNWSNPRGIWTAQVPIWCNIQKWSMEVFHSGTDRPQTMSAWHAQWIAVSSSCGHYCCKHWWSMFRQIIIGLSFFFLYELLMASHTGTPMSYQPWTAETRHEKYFI